MSNLENGTEQSRNYTAPMRQHIVQDKTKYFTQYGDHMVTMVTMTERLSSKRSTQTRLYKLST